MANKRLKRWRRGIFTGFYRLDWVAPHVFVLFLVISRFVIAGKKCLEINQLILHIRERMKCYY